MKDVFYTILVVWIIWKVINSVNTMRSKQAASVRHDNQTKRPGETTVEYVPPKNKKKDDNDEGEYVDYEEIK
jgi:hypothetical protein